MRRVDREMDAAFAYGVADKCEYAVVSMSDREGNPYSVPVTPARMGDCLYFHSAKEGTKTDLLRANPRVCVVCVGDTHRLTDQFTTEFESAVLFGEAEEVADEEERIAAMKAICQRHCPANMAHFGEELARSMPRAAIWRIRITSITGKRKKFDREGKEMTFGRME